MNNLSRNQKSTRPIRVSLAGYVHSESRALLSSRLSITIAKAAPAQLPESQQKALEAGVLVRMVWLKNGMSLLR
jgi:hypothetical protein